MSQINANKERSDRLINLFNTFKGKNLKDFPAPPFTKWLNGVINRADYGEIELIFKIRPEMANPNG